MTIYDIAKLANCSASTVSRVINGRGGVGPRKREEIENLLKQHNYMPDENARSLVMQTSKTIGILVDNTSSDHMAAGIIQIENELMSRGYFCFIKRIDFTRDGITNGIQTMLRHRVIGVLCMGVIFRDEREFLSTELAQYLPSIPIVLVNHMQTLPNPNVYAVGTDERTGFENSVGLLAARGCRNLVLLIDTGRRSTAIIRRGFELGLQGHPGINGHVLEDLPLDIENGNAICERILKEMPAVDGIIASRAFIAIGVMYALQDRGITIPNQVKIIAEGGTTSCKICRPAMTSLDTMLTPCATLSAATMLDVLSGKPTAHSVNLQLEIHERATTASE